MNTATTPDQRKRFYQLHLQEYTYADIAERFFISKECVRYWCRRQRDGKGVESAYRRTCPGLLSHFDPTVRYVLLRLKLRHPRWGPNRLRFHLKKRPSLQGMRLPSEASLGRYLHQWPRFHRRKKAPAKGKRPGQPQRVLQRWQIDFKIGIRLQNGQRVNLHTVRDVVGEACMGAYVYPAPPGVEPRRVPMEEVRATLRRCCQTWHTQPEEVQTDGEPSLVGKPQDNFPSRFTLWLAGLGILHRVIRPGKPTDNAAVERCHQTLNNYVVIGNEDLSADQLQARLDQAVYELAYELTSQAAGCAGKTPVAAHPELISPARDYERDREQARFDLARVDAYLATFIWERKVDCNGVVYLGERYSLGRDHSGAYVQVRFDPADRHFVCFQKQGAGQVVELRRWPARHLEVADLLGLDSCPWPSGLGPQQLPLPLIWQEGVSC